MFPSRNAFDNDVCPVGDELLGEMYRANENGLPQLVENVSSDVRAMLALFCYRSSAPAFAGAGDRLELQRARLFRFGGRVGSVLYALSRETARRCAARVIR